MPVKSLFTIAKKFFSRRGSYQDNRLDKKLVAQLTTTGWPKPSQLKYLKKFLNRRELTVFIAALIIFCFSGGWLTYRWYRAHLQITAVHGGEYLEGAVGAPRYLNPLHASLNSVDADLSRLIYSGLFKRGADGSLQNDLAENLEISPDQKSYTVKITPRARWHNGERLTADDVVFTFQTIKDPLYRSPLKTNFNGVTIEKINDETVRFALSQAYAPFPQLLTFGILPAALWQDVSPNAFSLAELNLKPVGSGPFKFSSLIKDKSGNIKSYTLAANDKYYRPVPYLDKITFRFFASPQEAVAALNNGHVDGLSDLPLSVQDKIVAPNSYSFHQLSLPRFTALFFNLSQERYAAKAMRQALSLAINKQEIVDRVFGGQAALLSGPLPPAALGGEPALAPTNYRPEEATTLLAGLGWKKNEEGRLVKNNQPLTITLTAAASEENTLTAEIIKEQWAKIGAQTEVRLVEKKDLASAIIAPRAFSVLLHNVLTNLDPDPYFLWHSSQASDYNLSGYKNTKVDQLLAAARTEGDSQKRAAAYAAAQNIISADLPAIFLYSQPFTYVQSKKLKGLSAQAVAGPEDRFYDAVNWYLKEKKRPKF